MDKFTPAALPPEAFDVDATMSRFHITREQAEGVVQRLRQELVFLNDTYQVNINPIGNQLGAGDMVHLSIKRRDKAPIHDWRDLQRIKNELVGEECEGIELYPADSRLVDSANQYHLWCFTSPDVRVPLGWHTRFTLDADAAATVGAVQRSR